MGHKGDILRVRNNEITHNVQTTNGQSGSPIFLWIKNLAGI